MILRRSFNSVLFIKGSHSVLLLKKDGAFFDMLKEHKIGKMEKGSHIVLLFKISDVRKKDRTASFHSVFLRSVFLSAQVNKRFVCECVPPKTFGKEGVPNFPGMGIAKTFQPAEIASSAVSIPIPK